jgi:hypothetical protein
MLPAIVWALVLAARVGANVVTYCPDLKPQQGIDLDQVKLTLYVCLYSGTYFLFASKY